MEATAQGMGLLKGAAAAIWPPRLEDAGLEDCALPPESINEAFAIAASSLKSRLITHDDDRCVVDPIPDGAELPDSLIEEGEEEGVPGLDGWLCAGAVEKGGGFNGEQDAVVVVGGGGRGEEPDFDRVLVPGGGEEREEAEGRRGCVVGGEDGGVGGKDGGGDEESDDENKKPILAEVLI